MFCWAVLCRRLRTCRTAYSMARTPTKEVTTARDHVHFFNTSFALCISEIPWRHAISKNSTKFSNFLSLSLRFHGPVTALFFYRSLAGRSKILQRFEPLVLCQLNENAVGFLLLINSEALPLIGRFTCVLVAAIERISRSQTASLLWLNSFSYSWAVRSQSALKLINLSAELHYGREYYSKQ